MDVIVLNSIPLSGLWESAVGFAALTTLIMGAIGVAARNLAVPAMASYLTFTMIAVQTDILLLERILYVTLTLIIIGVAMKLWRLEGLPGGEG